MSFSNSVISKPCRNGIETMLKTMSNRTNFHCYYDIGSTSFALQWRPCSRCRGLYHPRGAGVLPVHRLLQHPARQEGWVPEHAQPKMICWFDVDSISLLIDVSSIFLQNRQLQYPFRHRIDAPSSIWGTCSHRFEIRNRRFCRYRINIASTNHESWFLGWLYCVTDGPVRTTARFVGGKLTSSMSVIDIQADFALRADELFS